MNTYLLVSVIVLVLGMFITSLERVRRVRWIIFTVTLLAVPFSYIVGVEQLGLPKPVKYEYFKNPKEVEVLGAKIALGQPIYLLLYSEGWEYPVYYVLPWGKDTAEQLQEAMRKRGTEGGTVHIKDPFNGTDSPSPVTHERPPSGVPAK